MKLVSRQHAIDTYRNFYGRELRELTDRDQQREFLRRRIDLADLPLDRADVYAYSDDAWRKFLNDIIKAAKAW